MMLEKWAKLPEKSSHHNIGLGEVFSTWWTPGVSS